MFKEIIFTDFPQQFMLCSLLQTYTKLRQLSRFFSELLSVICQPAVDNLRPPLLSDVVSASLRTCVLDTPPSQGLEICSLVLESFRRFILPDLVKADRGAEKMEIDGEEDDKGENKQKERDGASMNLFSLSQLLHVVLFSLKTLDNASPLPLVRQSQRLMEEMQQVIKDLLQLLSTENKAVKTNLSSVRRSQRKGKNNPDSQKVSDAKTVGLWQQRTQEASLLLRYTWMEVDTVFHINCSKYTSIDSIHTAAECEIEDQVLSSCPALMHIKQLLSSEICSVPLQQSVISPSCSPMSCVLLKLLTLQQMKKVLLDTSDIAEESTAALLKKAAQFILAKGELEVNLGGEQVWDGQICHVNASSYVVAHWYLVTTNLPLIAPHLSEEDVGCIGHVLVGSLLSSQPDGGKDRFPGSLTVSLISSQLLRSPILAELPSIFSATVCSLTHRIFGVLLVAHPPKPCPTLLKFQEVMKGTGGESEASNPLSTLVIKETIVEDILASSQTGDVFVLLTDTQTKELVTLLQILTSLNPDGMSSEDLSSIFLLLFFTLTSTSRHSDTVAKDPLGSEDDAVFMGKLLRILACLLEGKTCPSVLKLIHGGTMLQTVVSSLLWHSNNGRFVTTSSSDWLDLMKEVQGFIKSLVQLIIVRNSSVRLNLDQFASYLTSKEITGRQTVASCKSDPEASALSVHLLLASLISFSKAMTSNLGRSKPMDQTLTQMLKRTTCSLGPAVESVLKAQSVGQTAAKPASFLSQAFVVEVVTVMLHCELSSVSVEDENKQTNQLSLSHISLYRGFCQQILKEISSAARPMDFLVSCLNFLSAFYTAVGMTGGKREEEPGETDKGGKELDELHIQTLQNVHRLLTGRYFRNKQHLLHQFNQPMLLEFLHVLLEFYTRCY